MGNGRTAKVDTNDPAKWREWVEKELDVLFIRSIPTWVRSLMIAAIVALFAFYGGQWVYNVSIYATENDLVEVKADLKEDMREVKHDLKESMQQTREDMQRGFQMVLEEVRKK